MMPSLSFNRGQSFVWLLLGRTRFETSRSGRIVRCVAIIVAGLDISTGGPVLHLPEWIGVFHAAANVFQDRSKLGGVHVAIIHDTLQDKTTVRGDVGKELAVTEAIVFRQQSQQCGSRHIGCRARQRVEPSHHPDGSFVFGKDAKTW